MLTIAASLPTGNHIADGLITAAAVITALGIVWKKVLLPIVKLGQRVDATLPVLVSIADEFRADSGNSLRDTIDTLNTAVSSIDTYTHAFKHDFIDRFTVLSGNQDLIFDQLQILKEQAQSRGEAQRETQQRIIDAVTPHDGESGASTK